MNKGRILVVDDNKSVLSAIEMLLQSEFEYIESITTPNRIPEKLGSGDFDMVLLDMNFSAGINSGNEGLYWLKEIQKIDGEISVVMMTAYGDIDLAVKAIREGATNFILKPWENEKMLATLLSAFSLRQSRQEVRRLRSEKKNLQDTINRDSAKKIIGSSAPVMRMMKIIDKVALTDATVLITGENGTGKELVASDIHRKSSRSKEIMVTVDMGAVAETLFESELFGHVKGSFTDAVEDRPGKFEMASGGTLFLDEIGNLSLPMQAKILSALQNREITRVGSNKAFNIDIRLICATNKNLQKMVEEGLFREDLLYRINTIHIEVPTLKERESDIPILSEFFLRKYSDKYNKPGLKFNSNALEELCVYPWPGNIRELQHTIEKVVILCDGPTIDRQDLLLKSRSRNLPERGALTLEEMEIGMIKESIRKNEGNLSAVASQLGITRQTLYNKIKKYDL
ncbi:MAG: sigma-54 dependent transcriptional regulator [Marinilabiliaceae bacterium]|jgi:DNA-binding NtrC family response regulator|nr:sigma-54 dependent transcriptional regulator [Marinilabiliaceae bacterium]